MRSDNVKMIYRDSIIHGNVWGMGERPHKVMEINNSYVDEITVALLDVLEGPKSAK